MVEQTDVPALLGREVGIGRIGARQDRQQRIRHRTAEPHVPDSLARFVASVGLSLNMKKYFVLLYALFQSRSGFSRSPEPTRFT